jgi:hypothetical protein
MTHNLNTPNKQWLMYLNTLSSISGDDLTIKPDTRKNLVLEVSGNNNIFIKKGDISYNLTNYITGDASFSNVDVSVNLNPLRTNNSNLGLPGKLWGNAYIHDISVTNMSVSGNMSISGTISNVIQIIPRLANDISNIGSATNIWQRAFIRDLSGISSINGTNWPITASTGPIGPAGTTTTATWRDISNLTLTTYNRIYQEISGDISWSAVNGYYGLAKHAYPSLNPLSSGDLAVRTWTQRTTEFYESNSICWSPELSRFVAVASMFVYTSTNGINWSSIGISSGNWMGVCWSPQLKKFLAIGNNSDVMTSVDGINWSLSPITGINGTFNMVNGGGVCWSPELGLFVAVADDGNNRVITSRDGTSWTGYNVGSYALYSICWSSELGIFVIVNSNFVITSNNGIDWSLNFMPDYIESYCISWSPQVGIFVALGYHGAQIKTSSNGRDWTLRTIGPIPAPAAPTYPNVGWRAVGWCAGLGLFIGLGQTGNPRVMTSPDGIYWTSRQTPLTLFRSICWSPELGIAAACGTTLIMTSLLKGRPPTSYNVFDSSFNRINENGIWDFSNINVTTLSVTGTFTNTSDDRLKHNELAITNGLNIIDRLTPKFYQKTQDLLDANYNGDLSGHAWSLEAGLIAQEVLQISDLSFVVGGGDYYEQKYIYKSQTNEVSYNYYEPSANNYELSNNYYKQRANNYEISYNLVAQAYNLNYNSVFVYGLAAIKELHTKVKAQESTILNQKNIINSLLARVQALEK